LVCYGSNGYPYSNDVCDTEQTSSPGCPPALGYQRSYSKAVGRECVCTETATVYCGNSYWASGSGSGSGSGFYGMRMDESPSPAQLLRLDTSERFLGS
jgi:hypothetical protein